MIFIKKISLLILCIVSVNLSLGQEKEMPVEEIGELTKGEIEALNQYYKKHHKTEDKKKPKKLPFPFNTFRYEFIQNGNEIQYVSVKNKAKKAEETIEIIPVDKVEDLDIIHYNFGFEYHTTKANDNDIERHYHENYIIYRNRKKYGLVLTTTVIPAKFDAIGKPYLLRGEKPMMLVAKKKQGKYKWGIVKSDGSFLLPLEYDEIIVPIKMDVTLNSSGSNRKGKRKTGNILIPESVFVDGLYHNNKIIVNKNGKYGLYNANGEIALAPEYDKIEANHSLVIYTLQKGDESGFLIAEYTLKGIWGMNVLVLKKTKMDVRLKVFPTKDYQIFIKDKQAFIKYDSGIVSKIDHHTLMKMIKE
jgi:hypothetical protein